MRERKLTRAFVFFTFSVDPFSKTGGVVDPDAGRVLDLAPKSTDTDRLPRSLVRLLHPPKRAKAPKPEKHFSVR